MTGTALIPLSSNNRAISCVGVSALTDTTSVVMMSRALVTFRPSAVPHFGSGLDDYLQGAHTARVSKIFLGIENAIERKMVGDQ